jgi:hypothetical protein
MKYWSWKHSPGAVRSAALLGAALVVTVGMLFYPLLKNHTL